MYDYMKIRCESLFFLLVLYLVYQTECYFEKVSKYDRKNRPSTIQLGLYAVGKYTNVKSSVQCAAMCSYTKGCKSYRYGTAISPDQCFVTASHRQWTGRWNTTETGKPCQSFAAQWPHAHTYTIDSMYPDGTVKAAGNSCRDPGNDGYFWCYTLNPAVRWERCDVDRCTDDNCFLYNNYVGSSVDLGVYQYYRKMP